jgi:CHAT domain-containing protein/tetratricopeptide (TPR) repeat protein
LDVQKRVLRGTEHPKYADTLDAFGSLQFRLRHPEVGLRCLREAYAIRRRNCPSENKPASLINFAMRCLENNCRVEALTLLDEASRMVLENRLTDLDTLDEPAQRGVVMLPVRMTRYADDLIALGTVLNAFGHHPGVKDIALRLMTIAREFGDGGNRYLEAADGSGFKAAGAWLAEDLSVAGTYDLALGLLASNQLKGGKFVYAAATLERDRQITKRMLGDDTVAYALVLRKQAMAYQAMGNHLQAASVLKRAVGIIRRNMDWSFHGSTQTQQFVLTSLYRDSLDDYLSAGLRAHLSAGDLYQEVLPWKGAVFAAQHWLAQAKTDPGLAPVVREWQAATRKFAALTLGSPAVLGGKAPGARVTPREWQLGSPAVLGGNVPDSIVQIRELRAQMGRLEEVLRRRSPAFRNGLASAQRTPADVIDAIPHDAALIDFLEYSNSTAAPGSSGTTHKRQLLAFVLQPGHPITVANLGPMEDVDRAVAAWRFAIGADAPPSGELPENQEESAGKLRRILWTPLQPALEHCSTLLVSPDGALGAFPFGLLPGVNKPYLFEERRLALIPVPKLLADEPAQYDTNENAVSKPSSILLVTTGDVGRPPLGGAVVFLERIETLLRPASQGGQTVSLVDTRATQEEFRTHAPGKDLIFILAHGFYNPDKSQPVRGPPAASSKPAAPNEFPVVANPSVSELARFPPDLMAGFELADGPFTALEVAQLHLSSADLVVLPVCQSGLGLSVSGEGLLGLQRAFHVAGAGNVISSLWSVPDNATRDLIEQLLNRLLEGSSVSEGLRAAQLDMRENGVGLRFRPYYWAGLVLSGTPDRRLRHRQQSGGQN